MRIYTTFLYIDEIVNIIPYVLPKTPIFVCISPGDYYLLQSVVCAVFDWAAAKASGVFRMNVINDL